MKSKLKLVVSFITVISAFVLVLTSCSVSFTNTRLIQKNYSVNVTINLPADVLNASKSGNALPYSFSNKQISNVQITVLQSGSVVETKSATQLGNFTFNLAPGTYTFDVKTYFKDGNQDKLFFYGSSTSTIDAQNTNIIIDTRLASGTIHLNVLPTDTTFFTEHATVTLQKLNGTAVQFTQVVGKSSGNLTVEVYPGIWQVSTEGILTSQTNSNDKRYSKVQQSKLVFVDVSEDEQIVEKLLVPSESDIGNLLYVNTADVHDGDTFKVGTQSYRLIGIDAPEVQTGSKPRGEYADESTEFLKNFVSSGNGYVRVINKGTDSYGRYLVYLLNNTGEKLYPEESLKNGLSRPLLYQENVDARFTPRIVNAYKLAYQNRKGIFFKYESAQIVEQSTQDKDSYVGKIVWLKGQVTNVLRDSNGKYTLTLDDGWATVELRKEEYDYFVAPFDMYSLNNKLVKFYGELWPGDTSGTYKILLRASFEIVVLN
ncbi:thermonuclease family protein [Fervidobacterium sp.]